MAAGALKSKLGFVAAMAMVIGGVIGSGIFVKPALMASELGSPVYLLLTWLIAGIITLCGALTIAEASSMFPETGGQYIYFQKMYGGLFAFIYGWSAFSVINTAGVASISFVMAQYMQYFITFPKFDPETESLLRLSIPGIGAIYPLQNIGVKVVTILIIVFCSWLNYRTVKGSGRVQVIFTSLKLVAIFVLIAGSFFSGKGNLHNLVELPLSSAPTGSALFPAFMASILAAFWAYDGWIAVTFIGGELKRPEKNLPRSLIAGLMVVIIIYLLINMAYLYILPVGQMAGSSLVAADTARAFMGWAGGGFIAIMVIISTFAATNMNVLSNCRVTYAMAENRMMFPKVASVHPRFNTPHVAIWFHCVWTCLLVLSGSFDMLTDMLVFISWLFYALTGVGVVKLRYTMRDYPRPYRAWGYPIIPAIFIIFSACFLIVTVYNDVTAYINGRSELINSFFGLLIVVAGFPLYWYFNRRKNLDG